MKRNYWAIGCVVLALLVLIKGAYSDIVGTLPYTLTNNTLADANQVMANFNAIVSGVNGNAATSGANSNITALTGLTTPLSYTGGGTPIYVAGSSTGSGNAQVVANPAPIGFTLVTGKTIVFVAGYSNSGPTTLNVFSTGVTNVYRQSSSGPVALAGGEIVAGNMVQAVFDGTQYQIQATDPLSLTPACALIDYTGFSVPSGYLTANGAAVSRTTYANLKNCIARQGILATTSSGSKSVVVPDSTLFQIGWSVSGNNVTCSDPITAIPDSTHITVTTNASGTGATTLEIGPYPHGDCTTTFNVPNLQARATVMVDTAGGSMSSVACPNPATVGSKCGSLTQTILTANLPPYTPSGSGAVTSFDHSTANTSATSGAGVAVPDANTLTRPSFVAQGGTSTPFLLQPIGLVYKAIKY